MTVQSTDLALDNGVSATLAGVRASCLDQVRYSLHLSFPGQLAEPVVGRIVVSFTLAAAQDVVFDFAAAPNRLRATRVHGVSRSPRVTDEHIVIPAEFIRVGENDVAFDFVADDTVLNRQPEFVYSLFVPARARLAFPCFDQPDIKARFTLTLRVPPGWSAVSNTPVEREAAGADGTDIGFRETEPLPTYLFAFVAGVMTVEQGTRDGRRLQVWHREPDRALVERNLDAIFDLHAKALSWLEAYTAVPFPFSQFDVVLVPSFQFSGMEHPGAILYDAGRILLESSASENDHLTRVSLIAHETAHIWFGDLVTMRWFDDVWLKEVFANFVAEKVVAEVFPDLNHDLRFYLASYPVAYAVDRSGGANPIRQPLKNLSDAGQLYGPIIYRKAPIVFRQLELMLGEASFREGVRHFLGAHRFSNASWADLLESLGQASVAGADVRAWSTPWIDEPGRPTIKVTRTPRESGGMEVTCESEDSANAGRRWQQQVRLTVGYRDRVEHLAFRLRDRITVPIPGEEPAYLLAGGAGLAYAHCPLDNESLGWLLAHVEDVPDALTRGVAWVTLWDELLEGSVSPDVWIKTSLRALARETDTQNIERLLTVVVRAFWTFLSSTEREASGPDLESCLIERLKTAGVRTERAAWFAALRQVATTEATVGWLEAVWRRLDVVPGLPLVEADETTLAMDLAVRSVPARHEIVATQRERIHDPERRARFDFIAPALSDGAQEREAAFVRLADPGARGREPWVVAVLQYLNHPLRQAHARRFLRPGLELLPEIKRTGDIFFPLRWTDTLLAGHASPAAAAIVWEFLGDRQDLAPRLRNAVLIGADLLFRSAKFASRGRGI